MALDANNIVIAKGGRVYFAESGTALPAATDPRTTLNAGFVDAGYITEEGVSTSGTPDILEVLTWQGARPARREVQRRDFSLSFSILEWKAENLVLAFGGGEVIQTAAGVGSYNFPADQDALDELSMVVDWEDLGHEWRLIWERGNVSEAAESSLIRTGASALPVTYSVLDGETLTNSEGNIVPGRIVSDHPEFTPVS
jgi:hypothetical protein